MLKEESPKSPQHVAHYNRNVTEESEKQIFQLTKALVVLRARCGACLAAHGADVGSRPAGQIKAAVMHPQQRLWSVLLLCHGGGTQGAKPL